MLSFTWYSHPLVSVEDFILGHVDTQTHPLPGAKSRGARVSFIAATWIDLEIIMLSEVSQKKNEYHMIIAHTISIVYTIQKIDTSELSYKTEIES